MPSDSAHVLLFKKTKATALKKTEGISKQSDYLGFYMAITKTKY
jgi:hypothetical protein